MPFKVKIKRDPGTAKKDVIQLTFWLLLRDSSECRNIENADNKLNTQRKKISKKSINFIIKREVNQHLYHVKFIDDSNLATIPGT